METMTAEVFKTVVPDCQIILEQICLNGKSFSNANTPFLSDEVLKDSFKVLPL